jgi:hypothetical protein
LALLQLPAVLRSQDAVGRIEFERTGYRLTSLGARTTVSARVLDTRRRAVPNRPIAYRTSDPAIASVTPQGVVQSRRVGRTRVWAVSGTDSASALIIVDQWASTFAFTPSPMTFDAIGAQIAFDVQLRDAAGNVIPGAARRTTQCRPRDDRVIQLDAAGKVVSKANGVTWIRCADRGIADSVRVEVRQRPARAMIVDKLQIGAKVVPDTFRLRMTALDPRGDTIRTARPTWASLNTNMVVVDPVSGLARAVGPGTARIVTQVGDATDTVTVTVTGTALAGLDAPAAGSTLDAATRPPTMVFANLFPVVGETASVAFTVTDGAGVLVTNAELNTAITSTNDSVIKYIGNRKAVAVNTGTAYIVARYGYAGGTVVESLSVSPRARSTTTAASEAAATARTVAFSRPVHDTAVARERNARQIRDLMKAIVDSGIGKPTSGRTLSTEFFAAQARHATKLSPTVSEARTGLVFGGVAAVTPFRRLVATGTFRTGTLTSSSVTGEDMALTEIDGQLVFWPSAWFGVGGGYMLRGESTDLSIAQWRAANLTALFRGTYVGGAVTTNVGVSFFPYAEFSGDSVPPEKSSLAGEAGLDLRYSYLSAGFRYYIENFSFPAKTGTTDKRSDQFSSLRFRIGLKFGR